MDQSIDELPAKSSYMRTGFFLVLLLLLSGCTVPAPTDQPAPDAPEPTAPPPESRCGPGSEQDVPAGACFYREDVAPGFAQWIARVVALPGGSAFLRVGFDALPGDTDTIPFIERSADGGQTWAPLPLPAIVTPDALAGSPRAIHLTWLEVAPDGSWHLSGNAQTYEAQLTTGRITAWAFHVRSDDEGATWSEPSFWPTIARSWPGRVAFLEGTTLMTWDLGDRRLGYALSRDRGVTWTDPLAIQDCLLQSHLAPINGSFRFWCTNMGRHARFLAIDAQGDASEVGRAAYAESAEVVGMGSRVDVLGPGHLIALLEAWDLQGVHNLHESQDDGRTWTRWPPLPDLLPADLALGDGAIDCMAVDAQGRIHLTAIYESGPDTPVTDLMPIVTLWVVLASDRTVLHHQVVTRWEGYHEYWVLEGNPATLFPPAFGSCGAFTPEGGLIEARGSQDILRILV